MLYYVLISINDNNVLYYVTKGNLKSLWPTALEVLLVLIYLNIKEVRNLKENVPEAINDTSP